MRLRALLALLVVAVSLFAFQNCGQVEFAEMQSLLVPECRDVVAPEVAPKLLWDWQAELAKSSEPRFERYKQTMASPSVADLNGDGVPEVVFVNFSMTAEDWFADSPTFSGYYRNGVLRIVDGRTGRTQYSLGDAQWAPMGSQTPLLMDIDNDGKVEIFYLHYSLRSIVALNYDASFRWQYQFDVPMGIINSGLSGADTNNDGIGEIIYAGIILTEDAATQKPKMLVALQGAAALLKSPVLAMPLDPSRPEDWSIVTRAGIFKADGRLVGANALDSVWYFAAADLAKDKPGLEIVGTGSGRLIIVNGLTGELLQDIDLTSYNDLLCSLDPPSVGGGPATIGDFDGEPETLEIAVATGRHLTIFDHTGRPKYKTDTQDCSSLITGVTSFDLNGDRKPEILYADEEYLRIFEIRDRRLEVVHKIVNPSGTLLEYPVVADVTGTQSSAILLAANNYPVASFYKDASEVQDREVAAQITGVRAFVSHSPRAWMPTRPVWNQHSFHPDLINDAAHFILHPIIDSGIFRRNTQGPNTTLGCRKS